LGYAGFPFTQETLCRKTHWFSGAREFFSARECWEQLSPSLLISLLGEQRVGKFWGGDEVMVKYLDYHKGCGGLIIQQPQDDEWGKWDLPVCSKCHQGPIVGNEIEGKTTHPCLTS